MLAVTLKSDVPSQELAGPRVLVTVGTDHHPFDRLIRWTNDWLEAHPEQVPGFFVQSGAASLRPISQGADYLTTGRLDAVMDEADVIVCHGGPATIAAAWDRGRLPIAVPRVPRLGEIVDDHQISFCLKLAELGRVRLAQTPAEFAGLLAEAAHDRAGLRTSLSTADVGTAVARFSELVDELMGRPPRRLSLMHRGRWQRRSADGAGTAAESGTPPGLLRAATIRRFTGVQVRVGKPGRRIKERG
jgi:UDP-N-acetylglucosamine transferase subunit ALG13